VCPHLPFSLDPVCCIQGDSNQGNGGQATRTFSCWSDTGPGHQGPKISIKKEIITPFRQLGTGEGAGLAWQGGVSVLAS